MATKTRIDYAKSGRTSCRVCHEIVKKGELRLSYKPSDYNPSIWYHLKCFILSNKPFNDEAGHGSVGYKLEEFYGYKNLTESEQTFIRNILRQYLTNKAKLKLEKHIFEMNVKELKEEMKKRRLRVTGKKQALQRRLTKYLKNEWCVEYQRECDEKCISGFCKKIEKENKINIPIVLKGIIQRYFPINTL